MDEERETEITLTLRIAAEATEESITELKADIRDNVLTQYEAGGMSTDTITEPNGVVVYYEWS